MKQKKFASWLTHLTLKLWPLWLLLTLATTALSLPRAFQLFSRISTDPVDLLPQKHPNAQAIREVREKFNSRSGINFTFEAPDPEIALQMMLDAVKKLEVHPLVSKVEYEKPGFDFFDRHKLMYLDLTDLKIIRDRIDRKIQREKLGGLFIDLEEDEKFDFRDLESKYRSQYSASTTSRYRINSDGTIVVCTVLFREEKADLQQETIFQDAMDEFYHQLHPKIYHPDAKIYISPIIKVLEYRALLKDLKKVAIISGILIFLPLAFRFRNLLHIGLIFLPLLAALPISFAIASFFIAHLNITTSFLFAILGGLGVENGIHIFSRYQEVRSDGTAQREALHDIFAHTGRAILTSVASIAMTFLLLTLNEFRGFSEFGFISGIGLWIIFLVYFTFLPSLFIFMEKLRLLTFKTTNIASPKLFSFSSKNPKAPLFFSMFLSVIAVLAFTKVDFEYDSKKVRIVIPEVNLANEKARTTYDRVNQPAVVLVRSEHEANELKKASEKKIEEDKVTPTIDGVLSYYDLVPKDQEEKMNIVREMRTLLADETLKLVKGEQKENLNRFKKALAETSPVDLKEIPENVLDHFLGDPALPGKMFYINALPDLEMDDGRNAIQFARDIREVETAFGHYYPANDAMIFGLALESMLNNTKIVLLISLLSVALFVFLDFRNIRKTGIVFTSIVLGTSWMIACMWLGGLKFNFYNMIIVPAVMGMSIDNAIHIFHRYEEMGPGSLPRVLATSGKAALLASLTNASGFFGLLFCTHQGLYSLGLLAVIGVATCLFSTLIFLPAWLQWREKRQFTSHA